MPHIFHFYGMKKLIPHIKTLAVELHESLRAMRRHLHQHPELSFQEEATARFIAGKLAEWGINYTGGYAGHGIVARIAGLQPGHKVVALRADMDALPIQEVNEVSYCSQNSGVMHACGHDVHTACLLGAACILQQLREHWGGEVKLIFQPAEELLPGGASLMIKDGALDSPRPAAIFGQHVHPPLEVGKVGFRAGKYMASSDELYLTVTGQGGHGAMPQLSVDPILIAAHLITALQQIVSRNADPVIPSVLTFGYIASQGGATNIIPNEVNLMGTFRTMDETWRYEAHHRMAHLVEGLAASMGGSAKLRIEVGYPSLFNDENLTQKARQYAETYLGAENVSELPIRLTSEDFAFYSQIMPACFFRLGTGNIAKGITSPIHTNTFDVDEDCLPTGAGLMAFMALSELE